MNENKSKIFGFVARMKTRQSRGASWLLFFINLGVITANVKLFFPDTGMITYIFCAIAWFIGTTIIGYIDEFKGIWKIEHAYLTETINPVFARIDENTKKILKEMEKRKKGDGND